MKPNTKQKISSFFNRLQRNTPKRSRTKGIRHTLRKRVSNPAQGKGVDLFNAKYFSWMRSRYFTILILCLITLGLLFIAYTNVSFIRRFELEKSPYDFQGEVDRWNGRNRINIAIIGMDQKEGNTFIDRIVILQINPDTPQLGIFSVNTNYRVNLPNNQSTSLKNAFIVGKREDRPLEFVIEGTENLLGIGIERYVTVDNNQMTKILSTSNIPSVEVSTDIEDEDFPVIRSGNRSLESEEMYNFLATEVSGEDMKMRRMVDYIKSTFNTYSGFNDILFAQDDIESIFGNLHTNLSEREVINLFLFIRNLRDDQIKVAYTRETGGIPTGIDNNIWEPVKTSIDRDLQTIFQNTEVILEQSRVEVLNATSVSGLATTLGRTLENQGCRVVRVGNTSDDYVENLVYVKNPEKYPETLKEIEATFDGNIRVVREEFQGRNVGDIVVVIGDWED